MINDLPTIFEVITGNAKQSKDQTAIHNSSKSKSSSGKVKPLFSVFITVFLSLLGSYLCDFSSSLVILNLTLRR